MSGYRDKSALFGPNDRPSRGEWLTMGVAVLMAAAMVAVAVAHKTGAEWYKHLGIAPVGIAVFMFAWTFFARARIAARNDGKGERFSPHQLRGVAFIFIAIGVLTVAVGILTNSKGA